jgi:hypothetical protein
MKLKLEWGYSDWVVRTNQEWDYPVVPRTGETITLRTRVRDERGQESYGRAEFVVESIEHKFEPIESYAIVHCRLLQVHPA